MYEAKEHEKLFGVRPIGVKFICPFCNEGEMKSDLDNPERMPHMFPHKCTKCAKTMQLNKVYPYIEWDEITEEETKNDFVDALNEVMGKFNTLMEQKEANHDTHDATGIHMEDEVEGD